MTQLEDLDYFLKIEEENTKRTLLELSKENQHYEVAFNQMIETFNNIERVMHERKSHKYKVAIFVLVPVIIQTIQAIRGLTLKGYYFNANVLTRQLFEGIGLCCYFVLNKEKAGDWLKRGKKLEVTKTYLFECIQQFFSPSEKEEKPTFKDLYAQLCEFAHVDVNAVLSQPTFEWSSSRKRVEFSLTPVWKKEQFRKISYYPQFFTLLLIGAYKEELGEIKRSKILIELSKFSQNIKSVK